MNSDYVFTGFFMHDMYECYGWPLLVFYEGNSIHKMLGIITVVICTSLMSHFSHVYRFCVSKEGQNCEIIQTDAVVCSTILIDHHSQMRNSYKTSPECLRCSICIYRLRGKAHVCAAGRWDLCSTNFHGLMLLSCSRHIYDRNVLKHSCYNLFDINLRFSTLLVFWVGDVH